jgi:hypothetical protein
VLTEIQVTSAPKADPKTTTVVNLQKPLADFAQNTFDVGKAIDGQINGQQGWAVSPVLGQTHWATFETKEPVGAEGGTVLTIKLHHRYGKGFMPGRFRLSATRVARPIGLGLADEYREIVALAPELRSEPQKSALLTHLRTTDPEWRKRVEAVAKSKAPLADDPKLVALRDQLAELKKPLPIDPRLAQLRKDIEMSISQAAARRLTAAQDIAWALINSPAFLFNH